ncbi:hypothetical protein PRK78_001175 [Emydomyces testavorans]|uniref:Uncharacterized protein n=1 Tax=Emydomyces testavorans TaxID=2070801 RepID=A0AAF0DC97_9EURO|nr:hypothetical protein PRK78_001175 [Emydomyces testavorans]
MFSRATSFKHDKEDALDDPNYGRLLPRASLESNPHPHDPEHSHSLSVSETHHPRRSTRSSRLRTLRNLSILLLALWGLGDLAYRISTTIRSHKPRSCNCGDTIAQALANNCKYDSIAAAWLPPACRDDDLIAQFERSGPNPDGSWGYYADVNKTRTLSLKEVSLLPNSGGHFFTTHQWHVVHCAYYWKKMYLAPKKGITIEQRYDNLMHINHCEMMFLKRDPLDKIVTEAGVSLHSDRIVIAGKHRHNQKGMGMGMVHNQHGNKHQHENEHAHEHHGDGNGESRDY